MQRDFHAAAAFLSSCNDGPFITLINRLTDSYPLFEYPATQLPIFSPNQTNSNVFLPAFEFYLYHFFNQPLRRQNLYQASNQTTATDSIFPILVEDYLNAYLPVDSTNQRKLYAQGHTTPGTFHQQIQANQQFQNIMPIKNIEMIQNLNTAQASGRSTLLRKDFSMASVQTTPTPDVSKIGVSLSSTPGIRQPNSPLNKNRTSNGVTSEIWRSETFARILIAFWLESYVNRGVDVNYHTAGSSLPNSYSTPLPTQELLRCIRMFIKHAHYFSNSCKEGGPYIPDSLRYSTGGADLFSASEGIGGSMENNTGHSTDNKKTLYAFFSLCIDHWPLDASFRLVLETWLSYIQPWRYTQMENNKGNANKNNDSGEPIDSNKWGSFVDENAIFYTNILGKLLSNRFSRLDMSSHKNSYMLYRIAKVYSQENLMHILSRVSNMQGRSLFQNLSSASPRHLTPMKHSMTEDLPTSNSMNDNLSNISIFANSGSGLPSTPVYVLGPDFKQMVTTVIQTLLEAKQTAIRTRKIAENLNRSQTEREKSIGFPSKLVAFVADIFGMRNSSRPSSPGLSGMDQAEKIESDKTLGYIEFCIDKFSSLFELESIVQNLQLHNPTINLDSEAKTVGDGSLINPAEEVSACGLSPLQRRDILLKKVKVISKYDGNPDRVPVRSDEFRFLVKLLLHLSYLIDKRWRLKIECWYHKKSGFAYSVFRQICTAPCIYRSSGNELLEENSIPVKTNLANSLDNSFCGSLRRFDPSNKRKLPARINLRPLASYKILFYVFMSYLAISLWQRSFITSVFLLFLLYTLWLVAKAMVDYASEDKNMDDNNKVEDMTLETTTLSPDNSY